MTGPDVRYGPVYVELQARSRNRCEARCAADCTGWGEHVHHRKLRSQGGPDTLANLLHVCVPCHTRIHALPGYAYERGLLVRSWENEADIEPLQGLL